MPRRQASSSWVPPMHWAGFVVLAERHGPHRRINPAAHLDAGPGPNIRSTCHSMIDRAGAAPRCSKVEPPGGGGVTASAEDYAWWLAENPFRAPRPRAIIGRDMLRAASRALRSRSGFSIRHLGLSKVGGRFTTAIPQLPGPDFHRQATTSLRPEINYTVHLQSAGRTKDRGYRVTGSRRADAAPSDHRQPPRPPQPARRSPVRPGRPPPTPLRCVHRRRVRSAARTEAYG
jgi:hypothetical protein